ncbi:hypothetical protein SMC26_29525 [Actinomadura fulvescens]|uniref:Uncharacterized protein n=1 Tax=Actinomadura fulvescens TaxID=46160 RepID=A0ABN3QKJ5_9ACTN
MKSGYSPWSGSKASLYLDRVRRPYWLVRLRSKVTTKWVYWRGGNHTTHG